jgi:hypothetical protein
MKILKAILMAPVRVIVFFIQVVLTLGVVIFGAAGGIVTKAGEIVGGLLILGSFLCIVTGQISGDIFLKMFLGGAAFAAVPAVITKLGEQGIFTIKDFLYKYI